MKHLLATLLLTLSSYAWATPTDVDIRAFSTRMSLYVLMKQTPDQVATSLRNYFGKPCFYARSRGWEGTVDIIYQEGFGTEIYFMQKLDTMPNN